MFLGKPAAVLVLPDHDDLVRILVRQRPEQHRLHEREDGGVGANAERQRAYRGDGEDGRLSQQADGVPQVGKEIHGALDGWQRAPVGAASQPRGGSPPIWAVARRALPE